MGQRLGRGINFGNALDVQREGERGFRLEEPHFDTVKKAGFDTIRLPVKWSAHTDETPPYAIDPEFFGRVDWAVDNALGRDLNVVLNVHHYDQFCDAPEEHMARFLALWRQIATRYADCSGRLYFELLNEPRDPMTAKPWNDVLPKALTAVRESNPSRFVIAGSAQANHIDALPELELPEDDRVIVMVHYYSPFEFTHQGADWLAGADRWLGTTWGGEADQYAVRRDLTKAAAWAKQQNRQLFVGEFGAYSKADMASRSRWTTFVRSEAERLDMSWAYWEFGSDFGAYDPQRNTWREPLRQALLGK
ncbi:MAG: cellulase family glycosylhydrolase [Streptosporangiales bacterium]|nr:cellulase family glycosylhydrolase [Streptosporangiales bacterium]